MARVKLEFANPRGERLAGLLETPPAGIATRRYALFAHCFTCGKDIAAASRISQALAARGIAVLRFDFTGLGNSDGDFANTSFSSNIDDLLAAAAKLAADFAPPTLLIGHSLGGAAVLAAAHRLPAVEALVTIGAPATATHVRHLFSGSEAALELAGEAEVTIGPRRFRIKRQFLDDLARYGDAEHIGRLKRPLLIFHSPVDSVVDIAEAAKIYAAARHPKSFISLDQADHLLTRRDDARYVAEAMVAWASRYLGLLTQDDEPSHGSAPRVMAGDVLVRELGEPGLRGLYGPRHQLTADVPPHAGGRALGPTPYDLLLMALGASLSLTLRRHADAAALALDDIEVVLSRQPAETADAGGIDVADPPLERIVCHLRLTGALTGAERDALLRVARGCPVLRSLDGRLDVRALIDEAMTA